MQSHHRRYFIELQPDSPDPVLRNREAETRREQAMHFIAAIYDWLKNNELDGKVSNMDITAFGQIRITCEADVISRIRDEEELSIAAIRPGAMYVEGMSKHY
jgi:hypothetical protein